MVLLGSVANGSGVICLADQGLAHTCYGHGYTRTINNFLLVVSKYIVSWYRPNLSATILASYDAERKTFMNVKNRNLLWSCYLLLHALMMMIIMWGYLYNFDKTLIDRFSILVAYLLDDVIKSWGVAWEPLPEIEGADLEISDGRSALWFRNQIYYYNVFFYNGAQIGCEILQD